MGKTMCPGQDTAFWRPGDIYEIACSECGRELEFFKDDATRRCTGCGKLVRNPKLNLGCAAWCEHAKDCLGYDPKEVMAQAEGGDTALVDRLIAALKTVLKGDQQGIELSLKVLERAKQLMQAEGGEPRVVIAGAILHRVEPLEAETLMKEEGLDELTRDRVQQVLAALADDTNPAVAEAQLVRDARRLVDMEARGCAPQPDDIAHLATKAAQDWIKDLQAAQQ
jgi:hypothetical protein